MTNITNLFGGSYKSASQDSNNLELVNMRLIDAGFAARNRYCAIPTAGVVELKLLGTGYIGSNGRCIKKIDDYWYYVKDDTVYRLTINTSSETITTSESLGILNTTIGSVKMADNETQIMIVDGSTTGYIITKSTGVLGPITDVDFLGATHVQCLGGYFFTNILGTSGMQCSSIDNGKTWSGTDVASAESNTDVVNALEVSRGELWPFGTESIELWYNKGNSPGFPFSPRIGLEQSVGTIAPYSIVSINDSLIWLDNSGFIVQSKISNYVRDQSSGYTVDVISNEALQTEIANYSTITDAIACEILEGGKRFYQITFPSQNKTWVCDLSLVGNQSGLSSWFQRGVFNSSKNAGTLDQHMLQYTDIAEKETIGCGLGSGKLYIVKSNVYTDNDLPIYRYLTSSSVHSEGNIIEVSSFKVRASTGYANSNDEGSNPLITMQYSEDGHTWSYEVERSLGTKGEYNKPIEWNNLGSYREWRFKLKIIEPVFFSIIEVSINVSADADE